MDINVSSLLNSSIISSEYAKYLITGANMSNASDFHQRRRRHPSFINPSNKLLHCRKSQSFPDQESTCKFVRDSDICNTIALRIDYLEVMVCYLGLGVGDRFHIRMLLVAFCVGAFLAFYSFVLGRYFILPNIVYIARIVRINSFQYGIVIMGLLLAAPQLVLFINVCQKQGNGTLTISGMLGRALSCYSIGMATIGLYQKQIKLPGKEMKISLVLILFILVFTVMALDFKLANDNKPSDQQKDFNIQYYACFAIIFYVAIVVFTILVSGHNDKRNTTNRSTRSTVNLSAGLENLRTWEFHLYLFNPYKNVNGSKVLNTLMIPFWIVSTLQVPIVDPELPLCGWSKYILCTSLLIFPVQLWLQNFDMTLFYFTLGVCVAATILVCIITNPYKRPRYHGLCALLGVFMAFSLFHLLDRELNILLLQVMSYVLDMPANISTMIGYSSCFVIFIVFICMAMMEVEQPNLACGFVIGIVMSEMFTLLPSVIFQTCYDVQTQVGIHAHANICVIFIIITISLSLFGAILTDFKWRPSHSWFLLLLYSVFIIDILLTSFRVLHPYGTHHTVADIFEIEHAEWA